MIRIWPRPKALKTSSKRSTIPLIRNSRACDAKTTPATPPAPNKVGDAEFELYNLNL